MHLHRFALLLALASSCVYERPAAREPASGSGGASAPEPDRETALDLTPNGARWMVLGDVARVRGTRVARTLTRLSMHERELFGELRDADIDLLRDLDRVLVAGRLDEEWFVVLVEHHLEPVNARRLVDVLMGLSRGPVTREVIGSREVLRTEDPPVAAVVVHEGLLAFVSRERLPTLFRDLDAGGGGRPDGLARWFRRAVLHPRTEHPPVLIGTVRPPPELPGWEDADIPEIRLPARVTGWASLHEGLEIVVRGRYRRAPRAAEMARRIRQLLDPGRRLYALVELGGFEPLMDAATVRADGLHLVIRTRVSEDAVDRMRARAELIAEE